MSHPDALGFNVPPINVNLSASLLEVVYKARKSQEGWRSGFSEGSHAHRTVTHSSGVCIPFETERLQCFPKPNHMFFLCPNINQSNLHHVCLDETHVCARVSGPDDLG